MRLQGQLAIGLIVALIVAIACSPTPTQAVPSSALCGANGTNHCPPKICDAKLGCVDCETDADCPQSGPVALPRCVRGACVACATSADCTGGNACWPGDHACHPPCTAPSSCASEPGATICNGAGACVGCRDSTDCQPPSAPPSPRGVCDPVSRTCVECAADADCPAALPRCLSRTGRCVVCVGNSDCDGTTPICDPETFACRSGCTSGADCPHGIPYCSPSGTCVTCLGDGDCKPFRCDEAAGRCVACFADADCVLLPDAGATTHCVNEACVQCLSDSECPPTSPRCLSGFCAP